MHGQLTSPYPHPRWRRLYLKRVQGMQNGGKGKNSSANAPNPNSVMAITHNLQQQAQQQQGPGGIAHITAHGEPSRGRGRG